MAAESAADYEANLSRDGNLVGLVDRTLVGLNHMYRSGRKDRPGGLIEHAAGGRHVAAGILDGPVHSAARRELSNGRDARSRWPRVAAIGQGWHFLFPINKKIWTSRFVLLTGGLAMVVLAGCLLKFDLWGWRRLARPYEIVGVNAILVFVGSGMLSVTLSRWHIGGVTAHDWLLGHITTGFALPIASVTRLELDGRSEIPLVDVTPLLIVAFWWLVCWILAKLGWQLRV